MASPLSWRLGTMFGSKENTAFEALEARRRLFNRSGRIAKRSRSLDGRHRTGLRLSDSESARGNPL